METLSKNKSNSPNVIFNKNINQSQSQNQFHKIQYNANNYNPNNMHSNNMYAINNNNTQTSANQGKIVMTSAQKQPISKNNYSNNDNQNDLNAQLMLKAMNQSYTQRMSGAPNAQLIDILSLVSRAAENISRFSMLKFGKIQDVKYFWRIVELDQTEIFPDPYILQLKIFQTCAQEKPNLKLYQLLMSLDGKQLRLQSMQDRNKCFNVNFDTVQSKIIPSQRQDQIILLIGKKYQIKLYVSNSTIPFYLRDSLNNLQLQKQIRRLSEQLRQTLKSSIQKSRGFQFSLLSLLQKQSSFFKKRYATEQQFAQYCQTGDILLFKDSHTFAQIQRAVTNSEYDHVGIVYRSQKYGICIFQSSSSIGVSLAIWTHLIRHNWFKGIESISWRRLLIHDKPKDYEQKVTQFINQNLHKKFDISFGKLMKFHSKIGQVSQEQQKNKTYFCSQLVATLYKKLQLIDSQVSATQYWPKHFSDKGYIAMLNNSALQHERELIFEQKILKQNYKFYK